MGKFNKTMWEGIKLPMLILKQVTTKWNKKSKHGIVLW